VFGLHRFQLHRHLVDVTVKSVWFRPGFTVDRITVVMKIKADIITSIVLQSCNNLIYLQLMDFPFISTEGYSQYQQTDTVVMKIKADIITSIVASLIE
jgi:hypothetical protein